MKKIIILVSTICLMACGHHNCKHNQQSNTQVEYEYFVEDEYGNLTPYEEYYGYEYNEHNQTNNSDDGIGLGMGMSGNVGLDMGGGFILTDEGLEFGIGF